MARLDVMSPASLTRALPLARAGALDWLELTKPRIAALVLLTTALGFMLAAEGSAEPLALLHGLVGTALAAAGANSLNQVLERRHDARMERTADRPIPSGRIDARRAALFGVVSALAGVAYLAAFSTVLSALVAAMTVASYVLIYTPLKRLTPWCTVVGAVPGALPPVIGWTAASGRVDVGAWLLFAVLFVWQIPHFWAIAWIYRDDYRRAGFPMLPAVDATGDVTARQVVWLSVLLLAVSLLPGWLSAAGPVYLAGAAASGLAFLALGADFARKRSTAAARRLMIGSIVYLPLVLTLMAVGR